MFVSGLSGMGCVMFGVRLPGTSVGDKNTKKKKAAKAYDLPKVRKVASIEFKG